MKSKDQTSNKPEGWRDCSYTRQLALTRKQERYARRAAGIARSVYNTAVAAGRMAAAAGLKKPLADGRQVHYTATDLAREFNAVKRDTDPYLKSFSKFILQGAFAAYETARRQWYAQIAATKRQGYCAIHGRQGRKDGHPCNARCGQPRFHAKKRTGAGGFLAATGIAATKYDGHLRIRLPTIGSLKLTSPLPADFIPVSARIFHANGRWMISLNGYAPPLPQTACDTQAAIGTDVGINPLAVSVDTDGVVVTDDNPKAYYRNQRKLAKWQRRQARRKPGSRGYKEAQRHIDRCHRSNAGIRSNAQHHISKRIATGYYAVGIESLNVKGMDQLRFQAKAIKDAAIGTLLHRIRYKAAWHGVHVVTADRWHPSSKTCSNCGFVNRKLRREATWICSQCGITHDRNINAARDLLKLALGVV